MAQLQTPADMIIKWANERPNDIYLKQIINREFVNYTYASVADKAQRLVTAFQQLGIQPGDRIALVSKNCAEWFICDLAMMLGGYVSVPIFPTAGADTISHCIDHSDATLIIIGKLDSPTAINEVTASHPQLPTIAFSYPGTPAGQFQLDTLIEQYLPTSERCSHHDTDLMSIVYTSGTSGMPKGAMLTYGAFVWSSQKIIEHISLEANERLFSYLPLAHITERVYIFGSSIMSGLQVAFPESLDTFIDDVKMHRPTIFVSVPRLWTLFQQRIQDKLPQNRLNILLKIPLISTLIKRKLAQGLGLDQARVLGCGSAPVSAGLLQWYESIGLNITEAWGMTESFAYSTLNHPYRSDKIGTVGNAGPGIELKIAADKEILVRSQGLFSGYYNNPQATQESFDNEGWLHTGDIGNLDNDGYLTIQGRKKDTFKTAKGKFVSPVPIEKRFMELGNFEMVCLIGSGMSAPILLAIAHHYPQLNRERYQKKLLDILVKINNELESHQKIKGILMIKEPWSIENGILTPTLKIKRHLLEQDYATIDENWNDEQIIHWQQ
ncbi:AMP-binding protein [Photobacterium phosphoreum]|jgi:long-subunit acyl-CoA synthetase (AMP-forming)|uniref:AMP-binding protein n=1 Tax=Photobacterium phosphoreum TaxID=659 RepID=A0AAW4ZXW3_PHOPO|nr:AMP-binding protein [Photobacterium phosphoreum]MCD9462608.1 AMP-dependent synthetase [Photobacterium phosphoreum]MCD9469148.1 AMP-dependent synthetase [Photobacterium phosphoreum]MCD9474096.1 AMP-binding protein [Photobacterium phosphoreum]MCD9482025.1 AMP-binding protein [Photobacterium phosphoreum]MCD9491384.1 AMP-binding protein [Photobacterium phosphoreum]